MNDLNRALKRRREKNPNKIEPLKLTMNFLLTKFISPMLRSWKTSIAGVGMIATGIAMLSHVGVNAADGTIDTEAAVQGWAMIMGGVGMIAARDANVTSKESGVSK